jgi:hypothetical protein
MEDFPLLEEPNKVITLQGNTGSRYYFSEYNQVTIDNGPIFFKILSFTFPEFFEMLSNLKNKLSLKNGFSLSTAWEYNPHFL